MLVEVARLMAGMVVMLAWHFLGARLVAVAVLVEVAGLVPEMVVMRARLFLWHSVLRKVSIVIDARRINSPAVSKAATQPRYEILCREQNCFVIMFHNIKVG